MTEQKKINVLSGILISVCLLSAYCIISKGKSSPAIAIIFDQKKKAREINFTSFNKDDFWDNYPFLTLTNNNRVIDKSVSLLDTGGKVVRISRLARTGPKFFFRIPKEGYRTKYIDSILSYLNAYRLPVVILIDPGAPKFLNVFMRDKMIGGEAFMLINSFNDLSIENLHLPYLFVLNRQMKVSKIFIPRSETPETTEKYLQFIVKKYINRKDNEN